ncbi:unnamed protein product [Symbiodinium sp. CCMP2456]|nr:unnamed protein product [Symbiodinium sp. CCMP2456]
MAGKGLLSNIGIWVAVTLATWAICWLVAAPVNCHEVPACAKHLQSYPGYYHVISAAALVAMLGHEVLSLVATYMGAQETQALVPHLQSRFLPTLLLAVMFGVLATAERLFSRAEWTVAHVMPSADGLTAPGRPVYTMQYMEWGINVPIMLILSGYCTLGRPLREVSRPLIVTNVYVIFCWVATATESAFLKWFLIVVSFVMYAWASYDMLNWCSAYERTAPADLPSRGLRPFLSSGLVAHLLLYGVVYMASVVGVMDAHTERKSFFALTFGAKLAYSAAFVFIRADEYHKTLTDVLRKVSVSNVGMISILRGSFDIILPCVLDAAGRCRLPDRYSGDMTKLEKILGYGVSGANLKDLLAGEDQKSDFSAYVRNVVRQADCPQAFNAATLSTQGVWSCDSGAMPPIAQVLHSKIQQKSKQKLNTTLHLSVVPRSALSLGKERQLVAAFQISSPESLNEEEPSVAVTNFETFKAGQSSVGTTTNPSSEEGSSHGIVANLADLTKLGASAMLGNTEEFTDEASNYFGHTLTSDETMSHLGAFAQHQVAVGAVAFDARIVGVWEGNVAKALGGYRQRIEFLNDCLHANVTVMGQTLSAVFRMDASKGHLDIEVLPSGSSCPPPAIPYIFKFQDGCLHLCGPGTSSLKRPQGFDGPGLCIMERVQKFVEPAPRPQRSFAPELEPDPEFSRHTTEETKSQASLRSVTRSTRLKEELNQLGQGQIPKAYSPKIFSWIEEQPAVAASALVAMTSAVIALRKSL